MEEFFDDEERAAGEHLNADQANEHASQALNSG